MARMAKRAIDPKTAAAIEELVFERFGWKKITAAFGVTCHEYYAWKYNERKCIVCKKPAIELEVFCAEHAAYKGLYEAGRLGPKSRAVVAPVDELEEAPDHCEYLPSPAEIRKACLRIQKGWSDAERERRIVGEPTEYWLASIGQVSHKAERNFRRWRKKKAAAKKAKKQRKKAHLHKV